MNFSVLSGGCQLYDVTPARLSKLCSSLDAHQGPYAHSGGAATYSLQNVADALVLCRHHDTSCGYTRDNMRLSRHFLTLRSPNFSFISLYYMHEYKHYLVLH